MGENYINKINYNELEFLRANTLLGPIALIKISKMKQAIEKSRKWYFEMEGELLDSDYTLAYELEYNLRFKEWAIKCTPLWHQHQGNLDLFEFSKMIMDEQIEKEIKTRKKTNK